MENFVAQSVEEITEKRKPGRPKGSTSTPDKLKWMMARGVSRLRAQDVLEHIDDRRVWMRLLNSDDDRVVLQAMVFLVQMSDGRPAQQINVTSANVNISVDDVERARAIVREIRNGASRNSVSASSPLQAANVLQHTTAESESSPRTESENT